MGFPGGSEVKASACNVEDLGSISGSGRFVQERKRSMGCTVQCEGAIWVRSRLSLRFPEWGCQDVSQNLPVAIILSIEAWLSPKHQKGDGRLWWGLTPGPVIPKASSVPGLPFPVVWWCDPKEATSSPIKTFYFLSTLVWGFGFFLYYLFCHLQSKSCWRR